jgi:hypothetical protein
MQQQYIFFTLESWQSRIENNRFKYYFWKFVS